jgi:hypothetical protein
MGSPEAIALVFLFLVIWVGTILVLLSRVDRDERRERRHERRASRQAGHHAH